MGVIQRFILRTSRGPLRPLWAATHELLMRCAGAYLSWGDRDAATYTRGSFGFGEPLHGISDLDMAVVVAGEPGRPGRARERAERRWDRLCRVLPAVKKVIDMAVYESPDLEVAAAAPTLTARRAVHYGLCRVPDKASLLVRPGLYGPLWDWRPLSGRPVAGAGRTWDEQERRLAAWLELQFWWRYVFGVCIDSSRPRAAYLCVKMVSEPLRIWLWLARGEKLVERRAALERGLECVPEEAESIRYALDLHRRLGRSPQASPAETLPAMVRLSQRLARRIAAEVEGEGTTEVRLAWGGEDELTLPARAGEPLRVLCDEEPPLLPLADWRALAWPLPPDETFAPLPLDPSQPSDVAAAATARSIPYPALRAGELLIMPTTRGGHLRSIQCPVTDPVSFALADGRADAAFPNVVGWSAQDAAQRAVAEHRAWLGLGDGAGRPDLRELMLGQARSIAARRLSLARLLTAARAALFADSLERGEPELPLTAAAVAERLGAREALDCYRDCLLERGDPPAAQVAALRERVLGLPAYRPDGWWTADSPRSERMSA